MAFFIIDFDFDFDFDCCWDGGDDGDVNVDGCDGDNNKLSEEVRLSLKVAS